MKIMLKKLTFFSACNEALDVGVIIDSSDSITLEDYNLCLQFVADLTKSFKVSAQGTHFGAIVYSSTPQLQFSFADARYYKPKRLRKAIKKFPYVAEGTRTDLALSLANMELFSEQGGDRADKPNVLIVITDGRTNPISSQPYSEVLQPLQVTITKPLCFSRFSELLPESLGLVYSIQFPKLSRAGDKRKNLSPRRKLRRLERVLAARARSLHTT